MTQENILNTIITFADNAHGEQKRKYTPERYIVHPVRVMETCKRFTNDVTILAAAILHDVLEDTPVQPDQLKDFLLTIMDNPQAERTLHLVVDLTDVYVKKDFPTLNRRSRKSKELIRLEKTSPDSQTIKYADIIDNTKEIVQNDPDFARVFLYECRTNLRKLTKGNPALYEEACKVVDNAIKELTPIHKKTS
ncbi:MAG: HD domain-containing protein [Bacteroidota bacterium]